MLNLSKNTCCRICGNPKLYKFLELGSQPLANAFLESEKQFKHESFFPLDVYFCPACGHIQLIDIVSPNLLFRDYAYFTSKSSNTMKQHFKYFADKLTTQYNLASEDLVIDIGSNDGTFLKNFTTRIVGFDPAENIAKEANADGVPTVCDYFTAESAWKILNEYGQAKVITATNVFAHVNNLYDFMAGVNLLLQQDGVFVVEVPHFLELYKGKQFDTIYLEHLSYFLTRSLSILAVRFNMVDFRVEKIPVHGGSIRCYFKRAVQPQLPRIYQEEMNCGLYTFETYLTFAKAVNKIREDLTRLLTKLKTEGKQIVGYGAPAKGNTLLNYCKIGTEILDYVIDTTPYKQGKFTPGMHIPVVSPDVFYQEYPDYALMLPWNYKEEILRKEQTFIKKGGKFIIPIPEPKIIP